MGPWGPMGPGPMGPPGAAATTAAEQSQLASPPANVPRDEISREGPSPHSDLGGALKDLFWKGCQDFLQDLVHDSVSWETETLAW